MRYFVLNQEPEESQMKVYNYLRILKIVQWRNFCIFTPPLPVSKNSFSAIEP
jgi:hypothetical protein